MMQVIKCKYCGNSHIGFGLNQISVDVIFTKNKLCNECHKIESDKVSNFFCSVKCFRDFYEGFGFDSAKIGLDMPK